MGTSNVAVNAVPNVNGAELYGLDAKLFLGVRQTPVSIAASSGLKANEGVELHPAFSWISLVVILIVIRLIESMLPEA